MAIVYIIDDAVAIQDTLVEVLESEGFETKAFGSAEQALETMQKEDPDLILLDLILPGMGGLDFLETVKQDNHKIPIVIITSHSDVNSAVKAMKLGAHDYITKPFNLDELVLVVQKTLDIKQKEDHLAYLKQKKRPLGFDQIIGQSKEIKKVFEFIKQVATTPKTTVLIRGETGTGKELVAQAIHNNSERSERPFIEVNCSAFQATLLEAELFGYEAGAFTGATRRKKGLLELAHRGNFFFDEIGDMDVELQSKILSVIEKQSFRRIGGTTAVNIDTRIISATSRNLEEQIAEKQFRDDLFYRLNVASIELPPLRDRGDDVLLLADHFLKKFSHEFKKNIKDFSPEARQALRQHEWPGNVRELKNIIEKAVLFESSAYIGEERLDLFQGNHMLTAQLTPDLSNFKFPTNGLSLEKLEKQLIKKALRKTAGNQTRAAKMLNISRETLKYRLKKYNISPHH